MSYKFEEGKDAIIQEVIDKINVAIESSSCCSEFARQFYGTVALEDLKEWTIDDLYGAVVNFWLLINDRSLHETKIKIYNPDFERHGWQTTHTVIEIICDDMPFIVDSVQIAINKMGLASHFMIHMGGIRVKRNEQHRVVDILPRNVKKMSKGFVCEAPIFIEIDTN